MKMAKNSKTVKNQTASANIHSGHRSRLRERFLNEGLENFDSHTILELLLFYSIPQKDTNVEAHALINAFGSLSGVFEATYDQLLQVKGIGENTATFIKLMPEIFRQYEIDKLSREPVSMALASQVAEYISKYYIGETEEKIYLLCLDSALNLISVDLIGEGNVDSVSLNNRHIIEIAYNNRAKSLILVHNHPTGITAPSSADVTATNSLAYLTKSTELHLYDHIIMGHGNDYFSFRESTKYRKMFFKMPR